MFQRMTLRAAAPAIKSRQVLLYNLPSTPFSTAAFRPSIVTFKEDKNVDPTPDKARGGSEQSMPGASGADIANSDAAYDSDKPRPDQTANKLTKEKPVDMNKSAASKEPSRNATKGNDEPTSSQGKGGSNPAPSGGSAVRGGNS
jgi:hypothetical protein